MPPERPLSALLLMAIDSVRSERQLRERVDNRLLFRGFLDRRFLDMSPAGRGDNFLASGRIYERLQSGGYPNSQRIRKNIEEGFGGLKTIAGRKPCVRRNPLCFSRLLEAVSQPGELPRSVRNFRELVRRSEVLKPQLESFAQNELSILSDSQSVNRSAVQDVQLDSSLQQLLAGDDARWGGSGGLD